MSVVGILHNLQEAAKSHIDIKILEHFIYFKSGFTDVLPRNKNLGTLRANSLNRKLPKLLILDSLKHLCKKLFLLIYQLGSKEINLRSIKSMALQNTILSIQKYIYQVIKHWDQDCAEH